jgi:hypothetical protein
MTPRPYQFAAAAALVAIAIVGCASNLAGVSPLPQAPAKPATAQAADVAPSPTPTPIQLAIAGLVGTPTWPEGDTATGGQGQYIAGFNCLKQLGEPNHHHVHLSIFVNGEQLAVPMGIGMYQPGKGASGFIYHQTCLYWLHTHDRTGILHLESAQPPTGQLFNLGNFFKLWGEPLSNSQLAQFTGPVAVYDNGMLVTSYPDIRQVPLNPGDDLTLVIGTAPQWIPAYILPPSLSP